MQTLSKDARYTELLQAVQQMHEGARDAQGRPRAQHFERVVQRLLSRNPGAPRAQIEAALLHDVLTHPAGGPDFLDRLHVDAPTRAILERIVPPPNANHFQDVAQFTPKDNADYLAFIQALASSGDEDAMAVKLADLEDTVATLGETGTEICIRELNRQYDPSRRILDAALSTP